MPVFLKLRAKKAIAMSQGMGLPKAKKVAAKVRVLARTQAPSPISATALSGKRLGDDFDDGGQEDRQQLPHVSRDSGRLRNEPEDDSRGDRGHQRLYRRPPATAETVAPSPLSQGSPPLRRLGLDFCSEVENYG
ncbi:dicarboxylate transporter 1 [Actinidia rufa]|uniref:Dicarboxylate transporter 1 n=1 Tax=Actinidia rufa TaxID=165716 RepID=A0A7J0GSQ9_9ERIC|nr:dicarboxylate transporter 1 [Actinidia rufa]